MSTIPPEFFAPITGVPNSSASKIVDGNVSNREHIKYISAREYTPDNCSALSEPRKIKLDGFPFFSIASS